jgi:hypothetical protein
VQLVELAAVRSDVVEASALDLLDPAKLSALAEDLGVMQRQRMHHIGLVSCTLIVSALQRSTDTQGRLLDAQRTYEAMGGPRAAPAASAIKSAKAARSCRPC